MNSLLSAVASEFLGLAGKVALPLTIALLLAAALKAYAPEKLVARLLGGGAGSIALASVIGAPIPLCSCSVLPIAVSLHRCGASKGAVAAFMVSAPAVSIVSIAVALSLLGPRYTVLYVSTVLLVALATGITIALLDPPASRARMGGSCKHMHHSCCAQHGHIHELSHASRFASSLIEIARDVVPAILIGLLASAAIAALVPEAIISSLLSGLHGPMIMLAAAAPMYVCAVACLPLAAALLAKGASLSSVLVLLVAGPATNLSTLLVLGREMSWGYAATYVAAVALYVLLASFILILIP